MGWGDSPEPAGEETGVKPALNAGSSWLCFQQNEPEGCEAYQGGKAGSSRL